MQNEIGCLRTLCGLTKKSATSRTFIAEYSDAEEASAHPEILPKRVDSRGIADILASVASRQTEATAQGMDESVCFHSGVCHMELRPFPDGRGIRGKNLTQVRIAKL